MDLDNLRERIKKAKIEPQIKSFKRDNWYEKSFNGVSSENSDISVVFLLNDSLFFCFADFAKKIKIPLSRIGIESTRETNLELVVRKIDSLDLQDNSGEKENLANFNFCKDNVELLSKAEICILLYHDITSYLNCLRLVNNLDKIPIIRILPEDQIAASGANVLQSLLSEDLSVSYRYKNSLIEIELGDGVIYIVQNTQVRAYSMPSIKDLIKGCVVRIGVSKGWIKNVLTLFCTSFPIYLITKERDQVRDACIAIDTGQTIPTRAKVDVKIDPGQVLSIDMNGIVIASDISNYYDVVTEIEALENAYHIIGKKDNNIVQIPLHKLID